MADWKNKVADLFLSKRAQEGAAAAAEKKRAATETAAEKAAAEKAEQAAAKAQVAAITFKRGGRIDGVAQRGKTKGRFS